MKNNQKNINKKIRNLYDTKEDKQRGYYIRLIRMKFRQRKSDELRQRIKQRKGRRE